MNRRAVLLVVAGLAAAATIALWVGLGRSHGDRDPGATGGSSAAPADRPPPLDPRTGRPTVATPRGSAAADPTAPDEIDDGDGDPDTRTYVMDNGAVMRDHRGPGYAPPINPPPMRPDQRTMSTVITARIYQQLAPVVAACGRAVPAGDRGEDPFVYVTMTVKVAKGQLTTTDVYPTIHDVNGASATAFPACVADKARAITLATADEPDHDDYIVQYPIRLK